MGSQQPLTSLLSSDTSCPYLSHSCPSIPSPSCLLMDFWSSVLLLTTQLGLPRLSTSRICNWAIPMCLNPWLTPYRPFYTISTRLELLFHEVLVGRTFQPCQRCCFLGAHCRRSRCKKMAVTGVMAESRVV